MSTVSRIYYWDIVNDDTMDSRMVRELISMLEEHARALEDLEDKE